jgi:ribonuclease HI
MGGRAALQRLARAEGINDTGLQILHRCCCYAPDSNTSSLRDADLWVFIINTNVNPPFSMFIKTYMQMQDSTSVLMAAALALAISLCRRMNFEHHSFFSDSQLLVNYLNGADSSNPPDRRIKPFTQLIVASLTGSYAVHKIPRNQNQMADSLARHGLASLLFNQSSLTRLCTNPSHSHGCPLLSALQVVTINSTDSSSLMLLITNKLFACCKKMRRRRPRAPRSCRMIAGRPRAATSDCESCGATHAGLTCRVWDGASHSSFP